MKIRNGFVSNSSSSSFIVKFPKIPNSVEEIEQMMFGSSYEVFLEGWTQKFKTKDVAKQVFDDMLNQNEETKQNFDITHTLFQIPLLEIVMFLDDVGIFNELELHQIAEKYTIADIANEIKKLIIEDETIYFFEYSDNDGAFGAYLEHGDIFEWFRHLKISHH